MIVTATIDNENKIRRVLHVFYLSQNEVVDMLFVKKGSINDDSESKNFQM